MIEGVKLCPLKHVIVPKGDIYHALKSTDEGYAGFGEAYFSQVKEGEVKGWKCHNRLALNIIFVCFHFFANVFNFLICKKSLVGCFLFYFCGVFEIKCKYTF